VIIDASAVIAILQDEQEAPGLLRAISRAPHRGLSAASYLESAIVADGRRDPVISRQLDLLLDKLDVAIEPVTAEQALIARQAYRDFGKGSGHPARLNFGDCFTYALAKALDEELLFTGDDFAHTDVRPALPR
jgi:ribonuclease VapC